MKPVREPASNRPKPCVSLKKAHESCPVTAPCGPCMKKNNRGQTLAFPSDTSWFTPSGFNPPLARRRSSFPPPSSNLVRTHPIEHYQALRDSAPCLSRAATLPTGTKSKLGREVHTWEHRPQPTIPPPRLNRQAESRRQPVGCISRG